MEHTPEPPAGSEHYREGWRHGYDQAGIDHERLRVAGRNLLDALEEAEVDDSFNPPTVANLRHYMTTLESLIT